MAKTERFTAVINIVKVTEDSGTGRGDDKKWNTELANIVVRNATLENLVGKAKAHLDLVEDS